MFPKTQLFKWKREKDSHCCNIYNMKFEWDCNVEYEYREYD
jgi:hypothetical protein